MRFWKTRGGNSTAINIDAITEVVLLVDKASVCFSGNNAEQWYSSHPTTEDAKDEYVDFLNAVNGVETMACSYPLTFRHFEQCKHLSERRQLTALEWACRAGATVGEMLAWDKADNGEPLGGP